MENNISNQTNEPLKITFKKCPICKKEFKTNKLLTSNNMQFCHEDFGTGTIVIGLIEWIKTHPEYKHPQLPKFPQNTTFEDVYDAYHEFVESIKQ